jgi:hypothetical protein
LQLDQCGHVRAKMGGVLQNGAVQGGGQRRGKAAVARETC